MATPRFQALTKPPSLKPEVSEQFWAVRQDSPCFSVSFGGLVGNRSVVLPMYAVKSVTSTFMSALYVELETVKTCMTARGYY